MIFGGVENINESAHMLGIIESALNKLEKIEKADYIDSDGKDIELKIIILTLSMYLLVMMSVGF